MVWFQILCCLLRCLVDQFKVLCRTLRCLVHKFEVLCRPLRCLVGPLFDPLFDHTRHEENVFSFTGKCVKTRLLIPEQDNLTRTNLTRPTWREDDMTRNTRGWGGGMDSGRGQGVRGVKKRWRLGGVETRFWFPFHLYTFRVTWSTSSRPRQIGRVKLSCTLLMLHFTVRYTQWSEKYCYWKQLEIKIALNVPAECEK